jgi:hypothetical protein
MPSLRLCLVPFIALAFKLWRRRLHRDSLQPRPRASSSSARSSAAHSAVVSTASEARGPAVSKDSLREVLQYTRQVSKHVIRQGEYFDPLFPGSLVTSWTPEEFKYKCPFSVVFAFDEQAQERRSRSTSFASWQQSMPLLPMYTFGVAGDGDCMLHSSLLADAHQAVTPLIQSLPPQEPGVFGRGEAVWLQETVGGIVVYRAVYVSAQMSGATKPPIYLVRDALVAPVGAALQVDGGHLFRHHPTAAMRTDAVHAGATTSAASQAARDALRVAGFFRLDVNKFPLLVEDEKIARGQSEAPFSSLTTCDISRLSTSYSQQTVLRASRDCVFGTVLQESQSSVREALLTTRALSVAMHTAS